MSQDDPFGVPQNPPGFPPPAPNFEPAVPGFEPLASGDESVLAASGLTSSGPTAPRNKTALIALGIALLVGGLGIAVAAGLFRGKHKAKAPAAKPVTTASSTAASPTPSANTKPPAKPTAPKPIAGTPQQITRANSGTLGQAYGVTLPKGWTIERRIRRDSIGNVDLRLRSADKTQSLTIVTIKPATATGPLAPAQFAAIRTALLKADSAAKALPGTPKAQVAGAPATGFDANSKAAGKPVTIRTIVWRQGNAVYAARWRAPPATFGKSLTLFGQLLAAVNFPS